MENKLLIEVEKKIITVRNQNVILDSDVAELYDVQTKEINQGVRNNPRKFPEGYVFELTEDEKTGGRLKSDFSSASFFSYFNRYTVLSSKISKFHFNRLQRSVSSPMLDVNKSVWERQF